jgi:polyphosphate kinase 2 (PPK2 family)
MSKKNKVDKASSHEDTEDTALLFGEGDQPKHVDDHIEKKKISNKFYLKKLRKLQIELVKLQEWIKFKGLKVIVIFEGRDAAGKGGVIKRITESLSPRIARVLYLLLRKGRKRSGISSATLPTFLLRVSWCSLTAVGTTGQMLNA